MASILSHFVTKYRPQARRFSLGKNQRKTVRGVTIFYRKMRQNIGDKRGDFYAIRTDAKRVQVSN